MHNVMSGAARRGRLVPLFVFGTALLGACSDGGQPMGARQAQTALPETTRQAFDCVASVADGVTCRPEAASTGGALGVVLPGPNGTYIRLTSSNASYNAGTEIFSVDVTVQNLMNEAIGTPDGVTPDPEGHPRVLHGGADLPPAEPGEVTVANADGTDVLHRDQPAFLHATPRSCPRTRCRRPRRGSSASRPGHNRSTSRCTWKRDDAVRLW